MYTIEINFKSYSMFHPCVESLESAKELADTMLLFRARAWLS